MSGLDAATGQMRWTLSVPGGIAELDTTADGGLAMFGTDGLLQVVGLSSGRPRWGRPAGFPPLPAAVGMQSAMAVTTGMVILGMNGHLTGYDDRTGRIRWTEALRPAQLATGVGELGLLASASLVYLTGVQQRTVEQWTPVLLGISAADGHVHWQLTGRPSQSLSAYGPGLVEITSNVGGEWQYALDPATGKVRWRAATSYRAAVTLAGIVTAASQHGTDALSMRDPLSGQTRWTVTLTGLGGGPGLPVFPAGPLLVAAAARPDGSQLLVAFRASDGHRAWQDTMPAQVPALTAVPGGMLVHSATLTYGCAAERLGSSPDALSGVRSSVPGGY